MKLLLIEDDKKTAAYIADGLRRSGHVIDLAENGQDGLFIAGDGVFDVIIVDRMLPVIDGLAVVKTLRANGSKIPILFLTALDGVSDRVDGLEAGADDYLTKPFAISELLARVHALARRPPLTEVTTRLKVGDLELDLLTRLVKRGHRDIELQPQTFRLLEYLMRHAGQVVTRTMLLERVWDFHFDPQTSVVETHVSRLRAKLRQGDETDMIHTIRGAGYVLRA